MHMQQSHATLLAQTFREAWPASKVHQHSVEVFPQPVVGVEKVEVGSGVVSRHHRGRREEIP